MPSHQWAVSTLIREVLADPDLAHDDVFRRLLQAGLQDLVDAEAAAVIGAQRHVAHAGAHQQAQRQAPQDGGHHRRGGRAGHPQASHRLVLPLPAPPPPPGRQGPVRGDLPGVDRGGAPPARPGDLVKALGNESGISRSTVSRICKDIDEGVHEFLSRRLDRTWFPYLFVDATYLDVRVGRRVVCRALVVATGVSAEGRREILGMALGDAETTDFWTSFLRSLRERGLKVPSPEDPTGVVLDYR